MRAARSFVVAILASVAAAAPALVLAAGPMALVVGGNSTYTHIGRLPNPGKRRARNMTRRCMRAGVADAKP